jgi:hypothetical protein
MRLLRFTDWSLNNGPTIESYRVIETKSAIGTNNDVIQGIAQDLEKLVWQMN